MSSLPEASNFFSYGFVHTNPKDIEEGLKKKRNGKRVFSNFFFCK